MICMHFTDFISLHGFKIQLKMYVHSLAFDFDKEHEWRKVLMASDSSSFLLFLDTWAKNDVALSFVWLLSTLKSTDEPVYKHKGKEGHI